MHAPGEEGVSPNNRRDTGLSLDHPVRQPGVPGAKAGKKSVNGVLTTETVDGGGRKSKQAKPRRNKYDSSPINIYASQINEFVKVTLKFKETITQSHL